MELVDVLADENNSDHDGLVEWLGETPFDPKDMRTDAIETALRLIRSSRRRV